MDIQSLKSMRNASLIQSLYYCAKIIFQKFWVDILKLNGSILKAKCKFQIIQVLFSFSIMIICVNANKKIKSHMLQCINMQYNLVIPIVCGLIAIKLNVGHFCKPILNMNFQMKLKWKRKMASYILVEGKIIILQSR